MEAFLASTLAVAIAEIGDKTQLLALLLVGRYGRPLIICAGILIATVVNHALSAWLGSWLGNIIPGHWLPWIIGVSFLLVAIWTLIPDKADDVDNRFYALGALGATCVLFFLAEIGDKTQVATVVLAARFEATWAVIIGTTLGMLLANVPVVFAGRWLLARISLTLVHRLAFVLFLGFALASFWQGLYHT
ncbi:MAG TPA: TMEM165/GDT1 family protein [Cellvibrionaceae bacterium]